MDNVNVPKKGRPKKYVTAEEAATKKREYAQRYYLAHKEKMDASSRAAQERRKHLIVIGKQVEITNAAH
jgi:hypothetical protein